MHRKREFFSFFEMQPVKKSFIFFLRSPTSNALMLLIYTQLQNDLASAGSAGHFECEQAEAKTAVASQSYPKVYSW